MTKSCRQHHTPSTLIKQTLTKTMRKTLYYNRIVSDFICKFILFLVLILHKYVILHARENDLTTEKGKKKKIQVLSKYHLSIQYRL